ncbi:MAG TPA: TetR family transcriptional regulator [Terriglobia bacterium]|nr:TetR family transcriptional regulator [Terriglobia bacterium]
MTKRALKREITAHARHHDSVETRATILKAAERIYAECGLAGARTEAIAADAGVNKALLYYYFKSKDGLYQAVVGSQVREFQQHAREILSAKGPAGPVLLRYVSYHFDFVGTHPNYPRIFQRMMMEGDHALERIIREHSIPLKGLLGAVLERGMKSGEFRRLNKEHTIVSIAGMTAHYFNIAPAFRVVTGQDPYSKRNLATRKAEVMKFIRYALFRNPEAAEL